MNLRLHSRLVALNVAALSIMAVLLGYFLSNKVKTSFEAEIENQLYKTATLARVYFREQPGGTDPQGTVTAIGKLLDVRVTLIASDGRVLGDSDVSPAGLPTLENHSSRPEFKDAIATGRGTSIRTSSTLGKSFIYVATTLENGSVLRVAMPLSAVDVLLDGLQRQLAIAVLAGIALSIGFGYMVYGVVSRPIRKLAEASQQLAVGNLDARIPIVGDHDLSTLGSSLNAMAKNLRLKMSELEHERFQIESVVRAMSAGVLVFGREGRIILTNESSRSLLEVQGDAFGRRPMEIVRDPLIEHVVRGALEGSDPASIEVTTARGKILLAKAAPVRAANGDVELAVIVFQDLTEIRRIEKMRKDFVANVSHEFKTPLTSIMGYSETLLSAEPHDPEVVREFLSAIERNAKLLRTLVEDLLLLAQLEGEVPVEKTKIAVLELIEEQVLSKSALFSARNLHATVNCPPIEIRSDRGRIGRALSNLLDNAAHYNKPAGEVRITASVVGSTVRIEVQDTGDGIPASQLGRIFERFYRIDKSRTRESGGTGLGLAIARHAVESLGGSLTVTSKVGVGSTFTITVTL